MVLGIIKFEMYYLKNFYDFNELKLAIDKYIEFYNNAMFKNSVEK